MTNNDPLTAEERQEAERMCEWHPFTDERTAKERRAAALLPRALATITALEQELADLRLYASNKDKELRRAYMPCEEGHAHDRD